MKELLRIVQTSLLMLLVGCSAPVGAEEKNMNNEPSKSVVIEVVTLRLLDGISYADFAVIDKAVQTDHVSQQPGFISRESAPGEGREWLVIVHWASSEDANASMSTFMEAPAAKTFMSSIDADSMVMKRYSKSN
jgi:hypothetical protein